MKNFEFLKKGRKVIFSLALFLLVFAAASVVKIHAGTSDSGQGWLWGGGAGPNDGTNTNVGWISMNNTNQGGATNYGVNIPTGNGDVTGYAWSENIGWISFNAADTAGCPQNPCGAVRVVGNNIKGWARILGIKDALAAGNSGGWQGWISLSGPQYGVKINTDNTALSGYGWSDELGWIDFSRAKVGVSYSLSLYPSPLDIRSNPGVLYSKITDSSGNPISGKVVSFSKTGSSKVNLPATPSCTTGATGPGECSINLTASDFLTDETAIVTGNCTGGISCSGQLTVNIHHILNCTVSCPSSIDVVSGQTKDFDVTIGGEAGCNALDNCQKVSGSGDISISQVDANTCRATAVSTTRYGSAVSRSSAGSGQCDTNVNIKGPGWVETAP